MNYTECVESLRPVVETYIFHEALLNIGFFVLIAMAWVVTAFFTKRIVKGIDNNSAIVLPYITGLGLLLTLTIFTMTKLPSSIKNLISPEYAILKETNNLSVYNCRYTGVR